MDDGNPFTAESVDSLGLTFLENEPASCKMFIIVQNKLIHERGTKNEKRDHTKLITFFSLGTRTSRCWKSGDFEYWK